MVAKRKVFTQDIEIFFDHDGLLIVGTCKMSMPTHQDRIYIAKNQEKLEKNPMEAAEFFYKKLEDALKGADLKVYQLPDKYILDDYRESQENLELLKHIVNPADIEFYEFASQFCNECMHIFGGMKLGKSREKSSPSSASAPTETSQ